MTKEQEKEKKLKKKQLDEVVKKLKLKKVKNGTSERYSFSKIGDLIDMPNLIQLQLDSFDWFTKEGLDEVLESISPITDYNGTLVLEFYGHRFEDETKYPLEETRDRNATYSKKLYVNVRLINRETGEIKEQEIFMGDFPFITDSGTFIINGSERVVVNQLMRSPGCYFVPVESNSKNKIAKLYNGTIMPVRGAWIEFETENSGTMFTRIDRTRKIPATVLIKALGLVDTYDILSYFGEDDMLVKTLSKDTISTQEEALIEIYKKLRPGELPTEDAARSLFNTLFFNTRRYELDKVGRFKYNQKLSLASRINKKVLAENIVDPETGEILANKGDKLLYEDALKVQNKGVNRVVVKLEEGKTQVVIGNGTVDLEAFVDEKIKEKAGIDEKVNYLVLKEILDNTPKKDLEKEIIKRKEELEVLHVTREDVIATFSYMLNMNAGMYKVDNIDHLANRRIRSVGELVQNEFRIGLTRMERVVRERMTIQDIDSITPQTLINVKPVTSAIKTFFGSSQLSQIIDQTNPLSELSHKRRVSALGPGGLTRERAGFEVRDIHYTHYGRLCPVESPEGPNVGLILHLSAFAKLNKYGFLETPYRRIDPKTHKITDEVVYMSADMEDNYIICQAVEPVKDGKLKNERVRARYLDDIKEVDRDEVEFMDVSPKQIVAVATAMIPFLENDDGRRALMGANMQRQAVPLLRTDSPMVGTGIEYRAALDSKNVIVAENAGTVKKVTGDFIELEDSKNKKTKYYLRKFKKTSQSTCINQKPIVKEGEKVKKGEVIADGMAIDNGEMAVGKNVVIAFANWEGYNFEDAVLISEKLVQEDTYTSVHIEEYECESRDTKLGPEEITREVPNVGEEALRDLDEDGIIRIGAKVKPGDILVGKITPKGETELTAEERLLRAIFGEKSREVRDTSLRVPHGEAGTVVDVKRFTKFDSDEMKPGVNEVIRIYIGQKRKISVGDKMSGRHGNKGVVSRILPVEDMPYLEDGTPVDVVLNPLGVPSRMNFGQVLEVHLGYIARELGVKFATPVFDGATDLDIEEMLEIMGKDKDGKSVVYDGRTGERFDNKVTVGVMYMLKLHHLVDDKVHARSTGSYSLVTKQPLGGKAQFGGQRLGEMEVWALEGYGAAYNLQEMLTVKSDDVKQREKTYEAIVKGDSLPEPGIPEGFKVLVKELESLGLKVDLLKDDKEVILKDEEEESNTIKSRDEIVDRNLDDEDYDDDKYDSELDEELTAEDLAEMEEVDLEDEDE